MKKLFITVLITSLAGCATTVEKQWMPSGGSKADGTVKLSYSLGLYEEAKIDDQKGLESATERCKSWGYSSAEPFGFINESCQEMTDFGCGNTLFTQEYQCKN